MNDRDLPFQLATMSDAKTIALLSRDLVEYGLGWSWTPARVSSQIRCPETVVLTARASAPEPFTPEGYTPKRHTPKRHTEGKPTPPTGGRLLGFAIMHFLLEDAHLNLLAVRRSHQRSGVGRNLVQWLERSASVAGICTVHLEVRSRNRAARRFYESLGYYDVGILPNYYQGRESAVRMAHDLRIRQWPTAAKGKAFWEPN